MFVDEAQDLLQEEVNLLTAWSRVLFLVADDRQKIFGEAEGLLAVRKVVPADHERTLRFHYRVAREICRAADRVLVPETGQSLESMTADPSQAESVCNQRHRQRTTN